MNRVLTFKKARSILLNTVVILLITLSIGEIALWVYNHYVPSFIFYSGSYDRFRGKPFANDWDFKLNSQGFKDKEFPEKKENVYRILGIGDSFSFGVVPYKYNYLTLIESQLNVENTNVEVLNMGIPSIGPKDYLSLLVKEGLALEPDTVLLSFFVGNDFDQSKKRKLYEYSYTASLLHYIINLRPKYEGRIIHGKTEYCDVCPTFSTKQYLKIEYDRSSIYLVNNKKFPEKLNHAIYYLKEIRNICKSHNIDLIVVIIPDELQINQDLLREVKDTYFPNLEENKWDTGLPSRLLSNELDKLGIDYINLYEDFSSSSDQLYKPRNTHWNIAGNKMAATIIYEHIRKYFTHKE
jgi:hypothetical protein